MSSERLVDDLVAGLAPVRCRTLRRNGLILVLLGAIELALYLKLGAGRHDIGMAMTMPSFWWKLGSLGLLTGVGMATAVRSFDPAASPRPGLRLITWLIGLALAVGWVVDAAASGGGPLIARLEWQRGVDCMIAIMILSVPMIVALGLMMWRGASTDRRGSALAAGLASAAWGAFLFVFQCPHDDAFYVAVWYTLGCGIVALFGRLVLPRLTRW
jgi:hypothetical protein